MDGNKVNTGPKKKRVHQRFAIRALMLSCIIDAQEGHDVATADISGAFMQINTIHMVLEGTMAEKEPWPSCW
jgi:hypothetical protein